jgi:hypothetical protein
MNKVQPTVHARDRQFWYSEWAEMDRTKERCWRCAYFDDRHHRRLCTRGEFVTQPKAGCYEFAEIDS